MNTVTSSLPQKFTVTAAPSEQSQNTVNKSVRNTRRAVQFYTQPWSHECWDTKQHQYEIMKSIVLLHNRTDFNRMSYLMIKVIDYDYYHYHWYLYLLIQFSLI